MQLNTRNNRGIITKKNLNKKNFFLVKETNREIETEKQKESNRDIETERKRDIDRKKER